MASAIYRFGKFRLDSANRELWHGDEEISLHRKTFDCIDYLIEHCDRAVERDELFRAVWGDVQLSDSVVHQAIFEARQALHDSGDAQRLIKTVRGFGYRWVTPVEIESEPNNGRARTASPRRPMWPWLGLVGLVVAATLVGAAALWRGGGTAETSEAAAWRLPDGDIALVLPVAVDAGEESSWIRFGVMELIAERLRAAGLPTVPGETVIALMHDLPDEPAPRQVRRLTSATGARLVLAARAEARGEGWRVSVHGRNGQDPALTELAEAEDVLTAARLAADQVALALGRTPAPRPDERPGLQTLLRRSKAAILAQRPAVAAELLRSAPTGLRQHPEVRLQRGRAARAGHDLDTAHATFEALLDEPAVVADRSLRARVLVQLAAVHFGRGDLEAAGAVMRRAERLVGPENPPGVLGAARHTLGVVALGGGDLETARRYLAQARRAYASTGDALGQAQLDLNRGVLEALGERPAAALHYFTSAADALVALHDRGTELLARANMIDSHLALLEPQAALRIEPRLRELLARTDNPELRARVELVRVELLEANGRRAAAARLLHELLEATRGDDDLLRAHLSARVLLAEWALRDGEVARATRIAEGLVAHGAPGRNLLPSDRLAWAWLTLVRAHLEQGDLKAAARAVVAMVAWARGRGVLPPKIYAALAQGEQAAAERRTADASAAFERAVGLAETSRTPRRLLRVAESFVHWLLVDGPDGTADPDRALLVADRVARYAAQDYEAALLQARVYRALGLRPAWREAIARARSLAGERRLPPELAAVTRPG